jgi:hypothetical protein
MKRDKKRLLASTRESIIIEVPGVICKMKRAIFRAVTVNMDLSLPETPIQN